MRLSDVNTNETVVISHIEGSGAFRARLSEMGFVTGKKVKKLFCSPVGNPIVFELMGGQIALRKSEAEKFKSPFREKRMLHLRCRKRMPQPRPQASPQTSRIESSVQTGINEETEPSCRHPPTRDAPVAVRPNTVSPPTRRPKPE